MIGYTKPNMSSWKGRIDSTTDYRSFRWHQYIQDLDLSSNIKKAPTKLSFILIGYKVDMGIVLNNGRPGAKNGPEKIREFLSNKPCSFTDEIKIFDGGDVNYVSSVEQAQETLATLITKCLENNYFPIVMGGGHDVSYGTMSALIKHYDIVNNNFGIINFDAHFDSRPYERSTSGTMFRQIHDDIVKMNAPFNHISVGIQKSGNTLSLFDYIKSIKSEYILAGDVTHENRAINHYRLNEFTKKQDIIYTCVCCDVFASPFAPGVSSPQPLGIEPELFLELLKDVLDSKKVVAFDIAEVSPDLDTSNSTASLGALIIYSIINYFGELSLNNG
ncbi:formiminoglutamase [Bacilli bacterium PM5-3]|nr:formiminoglutamase [Bacilli bacterium PM5-3]MDH6603596.1 formiminoglutamase [Bacilli bacterium PM5-9]